MKAGSYLNKKTGKPQYSPIGMYITEKYDGQRAQWDPVTKQLYSRYGNTVAAPQWYLDFFEEIKIPLDGELFFGYGGWGLTGITRSKTAQARIANNELWKKADYMVFDIPDTTIGVYSERMSVLDKHPNIGAREPGSSPIHLVKRQLVTNKKMLEDIYQDILKRGGEGVILNNPSAFYHDGRTDAILKYKPVMEDECIIVGYKPGNGRNMGRLGAFNVHPIEEGVPNSKKAFSISGMTDVVRINYKKTHPIGTIIHYSCNDYTITGKPRFPVYLGKCTKQVMSQETESEVMKKLIVPTTINPKNPKDLALNPMIIKIRAKLNTKPRIKITIRPKVM